MKKTLRVASPSDTTSHKTERTANQKAVEWINQIIKEQSLPVGFSEIKQLLWKGISRAKDNLQHPLTLLTVIWFGREIER